MGTLMEIGLLSGDNSSRCKGREGVGWGCVQEARVKVRGKPENLVRKRILVRTLAVFSLSPLSIMERASFCLGSPLCVEAAPRGESSLPSRFTPKSS